jgi:hypothetical protein
LGRSSDCDVVLRDIRASRHHADIRWDDQKQAWQVVDNRSTNHTYVNGMVVHGPYDLRLGDRITIGETTMVLLDPAAQPSTPAVVAQPAVRRDQPMGQREKTAEMPHLPPPGPAMQPRTPAHAARPASQPRAASASPSERPWGGRAVAFWFVQGIVAAAVVLLASGAFLPWVRFTGTVSKELDPLIQLGVGLLNQFFGTGSEHLFDISIMGIDVYGKLTLAVAALSLLFLIVDMFFYQKWAIPGIVYLLSGLFTIVAVALDAQSLYELTDRFRLIKLLFDIPVDKLVEGIDYFIDVTPALSIGLWLTVFGLVLLILGGIGRLVVSLLDRSQAGRAR